MMLKFSKANAKTQALKQVPELQKFLGKRGRKTAKVYSLDLLSGYSCPFAEKCLSRAIVMPDGKRVINVSVLYLTTLTLDEAREISSFLGTFSLIQ